MISPFVSPDMPKWRTRRGTLAGLCVIAAVATLLLASTGHAAQGTQVVVVPASMVVDPGEVFTIDVEVHDVVDLYGLDIRLVFDPTILEAQDVVAGGFLPHTVFEAHRTVDNSAGEVRYVAALMPPSTALSGSGVLARVTFRARSPGSSELDLSVMLASDLAEAIPAEVSGGLVVVSGDTPTPSPTGPAGARRAFLPIVRRGFPAPTPSPTPTQTATPTATGSVTQSVTPSPTVSVTPQYQQLLVNSSFETDEAWIRQGGYLPGYSVSRARSGLRSMRLGIIAPYPLEVYSSVQQTVDIPSGATEALLSLYYFPVSSSEDSDYLYVVLYRASDHYRLRTMTWTERHQAWNLQTLDLLEYAGQQIELRIGLYSDGQGVTAVYLDDVELWVAGSG